MYQRTDIKEGMTVRSVDGHKLGKVYAVGETEFHIEKGLFFPKDYAVRYAEISELRNGEIILAHGKESLRTFSDEVPYGTGTSKIGHEAATNAAWLNAGERTGLPFGHRPEELRTEDLGNQEIGPYNTEGARASPILTEEDRSIGTRPIATTRGVDTPIPPGPPVTERPAALRAEEESARERALLDERTIIHGDELYDEPRRVAPRSDAGTRKLDLSGEDDPTKRGL
ncbi:hypothetical protein [Archangium lipolyticum]|uniref:hypothetical protein n=1 Tax=Archangium lipolyticum TaxID=2970465 RepID=UPI002149B666|nr:hypothetical protein [Archangium lipolyticum]